MSVKLESLMNPKRKTPMNPELKTLMNPKPQTLNPSPMKPKLMTPSWVLVKGISVNYYKKKTKLFTIDPHYGSLKNPKPESL